MVNDVVGGHVHSSVYESKTGIWNILVGLLVAKVNISKQQQNTKSITYKNLAATANKKSSEVHIYSSILFLLYLLWDKCKLVLKNKKSPYIWLFNAGMCVE